MAVRAPNVAAVVWVKLWISLDSLEANLCPK